MKILRLEMWHEDTSFDVIVTLKRTRHEHSEKYHALVEDRVAGTRTFRRYAIDGRKAYFDAHAANLASNGTRDRLVLVRLPGGAQQAFLVDAVQGKRRTALPRWLRAAA